MICPCCDEPLARLERNGVEVDNCLNCGGFFLDNDEWLHIKIKLGLPFEITDIMKIPPADSVGKEKSRICSRCGQVMEKISIDTILLDRCPDCHGVWFDKGELSFYMNQNVDNELANEVICFLGENFIR